MNTETIKGTWADQKSKLKARFLRLINANLPYEACKVDEIIPQVQTTPGKTRDELVAILATL